VLVQFGAIAHREPGRPVQILNDKIVSLNSPHRSESIHQHPMSGQGLCSRMRPGPSGHGWACRVSGCALASPRTRDTEVAQTALII
jgi:hypothetical protein